MGSKKFTLPYIYVTPDPRFSVREVLPRLDGSIADARARGFLIIRPICQL